MAGIAAGSETISARWLEGIERVCISCGSKMPNLARDVGEIRRNADGTAWVKCMTCHMSYGQNDLGRD